MITDEKILKVLQKHQKEAVDAVISALKSSRPEDGRLGVVSMPSGTGKTSVMAEIAHHLVNLNHKPWCVLILTNSVVLVEQYLSQFQERFNEVYSMSTKNMLIDMAGRSGTILISTAQKLINRDRTFRYNELYGEKYPYSDTHEMLVISDEISENYFGLMYENMRKCFPNALFLGMTGLWEDDKRLERRFGPVLYKYSLENAYAEGVFCSIQYQDLTQKSSKSIDNAHDLTELMLSEQFSNAAAKYIADSVIKRKIRLSYVMCHNSKAAVNLFRILKLYLPEKSIKININTSAKFYVENADIDKNDRWDGMPSVDVIVGCLLPTGILYVDTIFLFDKVNIHSALQIVSKLARPNKNDLNDRLLVDFVNGYNTILKHLPSGFPVTQLASDYFPEINNSEKLFLELSEAVSQYKFELVDELTKKIYEANPEKGNEISNQLAFLYGSDDLRNKNNDYFKLHLTEVKWKSDLWCILSKDSKFKFIDESDEEKAEDSKEKLPVQENVKIYKNAQDAGASLENAMVMLIKELFNQDDETVSKFADYVRRQHSGTQNGFDITFSYKDCYGVRVKCMIECKNYRNNVIRQEDVIPKLFSLQQTDKTVDHWILISPNGSVSNELWGMMEDWNENQTWLPVRNIQFWTKDNMVEELFSLFPSLYSEYYPSRENEYISEEKRKKIISHWKQKLLPVPVLPQSWREYLRNPHLMLTQWEADIATVKQYDNLYEHYAPVKLLDDKELLIEGTSEECIVNWLNEGMSNFALLLGDFGDGKTFFTYTLTRYLANEFLNSPETRWLPLRFSLSDFLGGRLDCRDFLERRLKEFDATLKEFREIQERYRFLIILDGLDEMSLSMSDVSILKNLNNLRELIGQFKGHKIIVTSRKMAVYSDNVYKRVCSILKNPAIFHLAPISHRERVEYLENMANTQKRKIQFVKIQNTHNLIELAAKPLFLDMMQLLMDTDEEIPADEAGIYEYYAKKVLKRKFSTQLYNENVYLDDEKICDNFIYILEELALCLQIKNVESISLQEFKLHSNIASLADYLWSENSNQSKQTNEEDAQERLSTRSILKYDGEYPQKRRFCHRSMKEYFVARGLVRHLCENSEYGFKILSECNLGHEIMVFVGREIQRLGKAKIDNILKLLCTYAHLSRRNKNNTYALLSTNCVNILHYSRLSLEGDDWSYLTLNNVVLSGQDLSGKNFSHSTMCYSNFENTNFDGCDLSYCDFTGVQFEKSGQLLSFAVDINDNSIIAHYKDGKIRKWVTSDNMVKTLAVRKTDFLCNVFICDTGKEGFITEDKLEFWNRSCSEICFCGHIPFSKNIRIMSITDKSLLVTQNNDLILFELSKKTIKFRRNFKEKVCASLLTDDLIILWDDIRLELLNLSDKSSVILSDGKSETAAVCSQILSEKEGVIARVTTKGVLELYNIDFFGEEITWSFRDVPDFCGTADKITSISLDKTGGIYISFSDGSINRYICANSDINENSSSYFLQIKCAGAKLEGILPKETYDILTKIKYGH